MSAGEVASNFNLAKSTLSSHFNVLKNAGLIREEKNRTTVYYSLNLSVVEEATAALLELFGTGKSDISGESGNK
jgi:DNA-binding transcriptional ArsR family regulator